jgi:hypothetical protein
LGQDRRFGVDIRFEESCAKFGKALTERCLGGHGVVSNAGAADPVALPNIAGPRLAFVTLGTADTVRDTAPEPLRFQQRGP